MNMVSRQTLGTSELSRRSMLKGLALGIPLAATSGCIESMGTPGTVDLVWGRRGLSEGRFQKPRAIAIDDNDELYIVDTTGRIQVFSTEGEYLRGWKTPEAVDGRPTGMQVDTLDSHLLVADTHYYQMLCYTLDGELLPDRIIGGTRGTAGGEFSFITDAIRDSKGNYYTGEYSEVDRIQKFSPDGEFMTQWGSTGGKPGEFVRPQSLAMDKNDHLWIADSCNHRIQIYDTGPTEPKLVDVWGSYGREPGKLFYPYGIVLDDAGSIYVCEYGNQWVQKFDLAGNVLDRWGTHGKDPGQLYQPWGIVRDSVGRLHVLDSNNHRVQRVWL